MRPTGSKEDGGMGTDKDGKHLTPSHYGETVENCTVTLLLLRAWMLWRAHRDGWANAKECRKRQFAEERQSLEQDILKIQNHRGGSLGHVKADLCLNRILSLPGSPIFATSRASRTYPWGERSKPCFTYFFNKPRFLNVPLGSEE